MKQFKISQLKPKTETNYLKNFLIILLFIAQQTNAQQLRLPLRKPDALTGSAFAKSISDSTITLLQREKIIFKEIKKGNVPDFLRKLSEIKDTLANENNALIISYFVTPDYLAIGNNDDFFYVPITPILAQRIANLTKCAIPTKKIVDQIYEWSAIKLAPMPIPPSKLMTTVPVFIAHNLLIRKQLQDYQSEHNSSELTSGNKKDIVISNKIYEGEIARVVIYGWHQLNGKAIQPLYNKHLNTWADYSHGLRLVQKKMTLLVNGKEKHTTFKKILKNPKCCNLLSDEGVVEKAYYPIERNY